MQLELLSEDYLLKLASSDEEVTRHFVQYFGNLILIKLRSRQLAPAVIDEIRQETFVRVLGAMRVDGIRDGRKLGAFVNSTCNHVLSEHFRQGARFSALEGEHLEVLSEEKGGEEQILAEERRRQVHDVLSKMPARDRDILRALFLEDMDKDLACRKFGVDRGYLRVLLHRAKLSFRERFRN